MTKDKVIREFVMIVVMGTLTVGTLMFGMAAGKKYKIASPPRQAENSADLLDQYEWLKGMAFELMDDMVVIGNYEGKAEAIEENNHNLPATQWSAADQNEYNRIAPPLMGKVDEYNALARSYNEHMDKLGGRLATHSGLPPGANRPLPGKFKLIPLD